MSHDTDRSLWGSVAYQIYPRSFKDSSNDGVGDLHGIVQKLSYLQWLGVDIIWLSPVYASPMADFGYDVSDHTAIDPVFGTLKDFDDLITQAHARGIKVIIDCVLNHTSDQHPWFKESRSSLDNPKRDWYVWKSPQADGSRPNNWLSVFGGRAWQYDEATDQYYLHSFLKDQPDLNWENPAVRQAMQDILRFWLKRGVDGFRFDAVYWLSKDTSSWRNDPPNPHYKKNQDSPYDSLKHTHSRNGKKLFVYLKELADVVASYPGAFVVSEAYPDQQSDPGAYVEFYRQVNPKVLSPFNFDIINLPWRAESIGTYINQYQALLSPNYMPVYALGNHDKPRLASRVGASAARSAALLLLTLPGMPFVYYGDELGLQDGASATGHDWRDPERTPMPWREGSTGGFSHHTPWLPIGQKTGHDVMSQVKNSRSMLNLYRRLLKVRHSSLALQRGTYAPLTTHNKNVYAFARHYGDESVIVAINFSKRPAKIPFKGRIIASTHSSPRSQYLGAFEGQIITIP